MKDIYEVKILSLEMSVFLVSDPHSDKYISRKLIYSILRQSILFVCFNALCPSNQFFSHFGTVSWVVLVLNSR